MVRPDNRYHIASVVLEETLLGDDTGRAMSLQLTLGRCEGVEHQEGWRGGPLLHGPPSPGCADLCWPPLAQYPHQ